MKTNDSNPPVLSLLYHFFNRGGLLGLESTPITRGVNTGCRVYFVGRTPDVLWYNLHSFRGSVRRGTRSPDDPEFPRIPTGPRESGKTGSLTMVFGPFSILRESTIDVNLERNVCPLLLLRLPSLLTRTGSGDSEVLFRSPW